MMKNLLVAGAVCCVFGGAGSAFAKPASTQTYCLPASAGVQPACINLYVQGFIDETDTSVSPSGTAHPVSQSEPMPVTVVGGSTGGGGSVGTQATPSYETAYSPTPSACSTSTVGTTATLILDTAANVGRAGGGIQVPATATAPIEYQWSNSGTGLTTTPGGIVFQVTAGGQVPFVGAPSSQLYAISTASQSVSCFVAK